MMQPGPSARPCSRPTPGRKSSQALLRCVVAAGPPGAYNIAADGIITTADIARELGLLPLPLPVGTTQSVALVLASLPFLPPIAQWAEAAIHPAIMDTSRAKQELGWAPRFTAIDALLDTLRPLRHQRAGLTARRP